jgi:hypothetical protein
MIKDLHIYFHTEEEQAVVERLRAQNVNIQTLIREFLLAKVKELERK